MAGQKSESGRRELKRARVPLGVHPRRSGGQFPGSGRTAALVRDRSQSGQSPRCRGKDRRVNPGLGRAAAESADVVPALCGEPSGGAPRSGVGALAPERRRLAPWGETGAASRAAPANTPWTRLRGICATRLLGRRSRRSKCMRTARPRFFPPHAALRAVRHWEGECPVLTNARDKIKDAEKIT